MNETCRWMPGIMDFKFVINVLSEYLITHGRWLNKLKLMLLEHNTIKRYGFKAYMGLDMINNRI